MDSILQKISQKRCGKSSYTYSTGDPKALFRKVAVVEPLKISPQRIVVPPRSSTTKGASAAFEPMKFRQFVYLLKRRKENCSPAYRGKDRRDDKMRLCDDEGTQPRLARARQQEGLVIPHHRRETISFPSSSSAYSPGDIYTRRDARRQNPRPSCCAVAFLYKGSARSSLVAQTAFVRVWYMHQIQSEETQRLNAMRQLFPRFRKLGLFVQRLLEYFV